MAFVGEGVRLILPAEPVEAEIGSATATLGIRPEDLTLVSDGQAAAAADAATLSGRVLLVERLGGTSHIHVAVGRHRLIASVTMDQLPAVGDLVDLHVPRARMHFFGSDGRSLP